MKVYIVNQDAFVDLGGGYLLRIATAEEARTLTLAELKVKAMIAVAEKEAQK
jgi:hypothetical protein